ncbi:COQ9 family protein [Sphingomonas sp. H39-1-10]|uniref:COQ9 family protein n=1 Tax=Sphingomonas TaxID=13687 RepID=UPI00088CDFC6|nr:MULTISPECIES: COQ9 family protein [Sphingomonas]MDF0488124.1 COQ9 family protein [Sphingomonas pollutisoli]SDA33600.1 ubiquinone biosynthesis protein COQ9 [Sphingomonas sp. NFR15]
MPIIPEDATLDEIAVQLAPLIAANAAFDGWGAAARDAAADAAGVDRDVASLALPGQIEMIAAWFGSINADMVERLPPEAVATMKIRARITALVEARLAIVAPNREALRRAFAILAMPQNITAGARLGWSAADAIWRAAGDTATDYNHYTKRTILAAIYAATMSVFLDDESEGWADTRAFLARRIEGIMRFEKTKAGLLARAAYRPSLSRFIGRLRYPAV